MALGEDGTGAAGGDSGAGGANVADALGLEGGGGDGGQGGQQDGGQGSQGGGAQEIANAPDPDFYQHLSADLGEGETASNRDWVKSRGVKDLDGLVKSFRDTQRALHDSGRIKVPGEGATPEDVAAFHRAIGVPDAPDGYEFKAPVGADGQPIALDTELLGTLSTTAHKLGIPKPALEGLVGEYVKAQMDQMQAFETQARKDANDWVKEQGQAAAAKVAAVQRAADHIGLTREELIAARNVWGGKRAMEIFTRLGEGMAEDTMLEGGSRQRFAISGAEAQTQLDDMKTKAGSDPMFAAKVNTKGSPENLRWNRLTEAVAAHEERQRSAA